MSAARFLRPSRRGAAQVALCLCLQQLAACAGAPAGQGAGSAEDAGTASAAEPAPPAVSPDLLPAPAVFEATGTARWDGRRTLQGVWVAHPQASTARRVRIYNDATGAAADGALFTRDAVLAGPSMLISSDAAQLLGMAPGEEAALRVVAVTPRAENQAAALAAAVPSEPPPGAVSPARPPAGPGAASPPAVSREAVRPAAPARAAAEPAPTAAVPAGPAVPTVPPPAPEAELAASPAPESVASPAPETAELATEPAAPTAAPAAPTAAPTVALRAEPAAEPAAPPALAARPSPEAGPPPAVDSAPAEAVPAASAPAGEAASATAAAPAVDVAPRQTEALAQPYVQAGLFAVRDNADRLIGRLEAAGLPALGKPVRLADGPATRVLAGPFATVAERDAARRRIQGMGLRDAVPVAR